MPDYLQRQWMIAAGIMLGLGVFVVSTHGYPLAARLLTGLATSASACWIADAAISLRNYSAGRVEPDGRFALRRFALGYVAMLVLQLAGIQSYAVISGTEQPVGAWVFAFVSSVIFAVFYAGVLHPMIRWSSRHAWFKAWRGPGE